MKASFEKKDKSSLTEVYMKKLEQIEGLQQYRKDPEIFQPDSCKIKPFLIHSFSNLHTDFHYLSFLNNEDIDEELVKVCEILQILPCSAYKKSKLFDKWNENDIHKFWLKFFCLFQLGLNNQLSIGDMFAFESKSNFFKSFSKTMQYMNCDFPVINSKRISKINLNDEIKSWQEVSITNKLSESEESNDYDYHTKVTYNINPSKLIVDLKFIISSFTNLKITEEQNLVSAKLLTNFINTTKEVLEYNNYLNFIESKINEKHVLEQYLKSSTENKLSSSLHFLKTYINLNDVIKSKIKLLY